MLSLSMLLELLINFNIRGIIMQVWNKTAGTIVKGLNTIDTTLDGVNEAVHASHHLARTMKKSARRIEILNEIENLSTIADAAEEAGISAEQLAAIVADIDGD